jgi:putative FmdB family regulatory protein
MPTYEFRCKKCGKKLTLRITFSEYEAKHFKCSKCGSKQLERLISPFRVQTSKKS